MSGSLFSSSLIKAQSSSAFPVTALKMGGVVFTPIIFEVKCV